MADWLAWTMLAGVLVVLEMFTGTFYLLMVALGLAAGGVAAFCEASVAAQFLLAAIVGIAATYALRRSRPGRFSQREATRDPNVNLDIGQTLRIKAWDHPHGETRTMRALYRGAMWDIELERDAEARPGTFVIREVRGSRLVVANAVSHSG